MNAITRATASHDLVCDACGEPNKHVANVRVSLRVSTQPARALIGLCAPCAERAGRVARGHEVAS